MPDMSPAAHCLCLLAIRIWAHSLSYTRVNSQVLQVTAMCMLSPGHGSKAAYSSIQAQSVLQGTAFALQNSHPAVTFPGKPVLVPA